MSETNETRLSRRHVLKSGALAAAALGLGTIAPLALFPSTVVAGSGSGSGSGGAGGAGGADASVWRQAGRILARVKSPRFPNRTFDITKYGAVNGGTTKCTDAIRKAIKACHAAGGGHVVVPAGTFLTGAIRLLSNVDLHLAKGATLAFSQDPNDYLPVVYTRWQGIELMNYSAFIYAFEQENVGVTGDGTLDGQADIDHWWPWKAGNPNQTADDNLSQKMADDGVPVSKRVFGAGHYLRPNFIQPYRCRNVVISGVTIVRSPMWEIHPVLSHNVTVQGVTVNSHGPNNDGCDPECCRDVVIEGCTFDTGDDCIAIKAGKNADGRRVNVPSEDIVIRNCTFADGHGGVTIGSEMTGGVRNIFAEDLQMSSPNLNNCLRLKTNSLRGGFIENVHMRNTTVGQVSAEAFLIDFFYGPDNGLGGFNPTVADITMSNVTVGAAKEAFYLVGYANDHIQGIALTNCVFSNVVLSPGYTVQYVDDLELRNVVVNGTQLPNATAARAAVPV